MQDKIEELIRAVYKKWKKDQVSNPVDHPDEETMTCFLENRLSELETEQIKAHIVGCDRCAEIISVQLRLKSTSPDEVPAQLLLWAKELIKAEDKTSILEIFLRLKEKAIEMLNTTGDVLVGQELVPAPVLRSRSTKDFKDEITILKDFKDIRVEIKLENKRGEAFDLTVMVKDKASQNIIKDLRVTLIKDDIELESYLSDTGRVIFEHVALGKYTVEISSIENKLASILLDIKV